MTENASTDIETLSIGVLDVMLERDGKFIPGRYGQLLAELASLVHGHPVAVGDNEYHRMSLVVLRLEQLGFIAVQRAYKDEPAKANVLEKVTLL